MLLCVVCASVRAQVVGVRVVRCVWREWSPGSCVGPRSASGIYICLYAGILKINTDFLAVEPLEARRARVPHRYALYPSTTGGVSHSLVVG